MKACLPSNQCTVPENTKLLQDIKPIIINDDEDQDISNLDKNDVAMNKEITSHITPPRTPNQVYSQPIIWLPPRAPDSSESNPRSQHRLKPILILKRIHLIRKA